MIQKVEMLQSWIEKLTFQLKSMKKRDADSKLNGEICLLKAESSKVLRFVAEETTAVFGGNALHFGVNKIEGMWLQVNPVPVVPEINYVTDCFLFKGQGV